MEEVIHLWIISVEPILLLKGPKVAQSIGISSKNFNEEAILEQIMLLKLLLLTNLEKQILLKPMKYLIQQMED